MNILFLDSIEVETYGGMEEWIRLVAQGLADRNHKVTIVGRSGSKFLARAKKNSNNINFLPLNISGDFNPSTINKIKKFITENKIDIVVTNFTKDIRLGGLAARWEGSPKVIWSVGLDITKDSFSHKFLTPKLIDGVITPSEALKKQIISKGYIEPDSVKVIPIGIPPIKNKHDKVLAKDSICNKYDIAKDSIIAITSGRFVDQKGHKFLVEAAPAIIENYPKIKFLWLGDGPLKGLLQDRIKSLNIENYFIFAGMLDNLDKELAGSDLMIHPSVEEPFGISILEGMRAGLPIVASKVGGIPEVVKDGATAVLIESEKQDLISTTVNKLLSNPDRMLTMGMAGVKRWEDIFQLEMMISNIEQYLNRYCSKITN